MTQAEALTLSDMSAAKGPFIVVAMFGSRSYKEWEVSSYDTLEEAQEVAKDTQYAVIAKIIEGPE